MIKAFLFYALFATSVFTQRKATEQQSPSLTYQHVAMRQEPYQIDQNAVRTLQLVKSDSAVVER